MTRKRAFAMGALAALVLLLAGAASFLRGCSLCFSKSETEGNPAIFCNRVGHCAFVGRYEWDGELGSRPSRCRTHGTACPSLPWGALRDGECPRPLSSICRRRPVSVSGLKVQ